MVTEPSSEPITTDDLVEIYHGSVRCIEEYFINGAGSEWLAYYDFRNPVAVALCQGAALHYCNGKNGIKDFDVWFFYPYSVKHLPYRHTWTWDYENAKFGRNPNHPAFSGRKVDVLVRSIRCYVEHDPIDTNLRYLKEERSVTYRFGWRLAI